MRGNSTHKILPTLLFLAFENIRLSSLFSGRFAKRNAPSTASRRDGWIRRLCQPQHQFFSIITFNLSITMSPWLTPPPAGWPSNNLHRTTGTIIFLIIITMVTTGYQLIITVVTGIPITLHKKYVYRRPLRLKDSERANSQRVTLQVAHFQARASP